MGMPTARKHRAFHRHQSSSARTRIVSAAKPSRQATFPSGGKEKETRVQLLPGLFAGIAFDQFHPLALLLLRFNKRPNINIRWKIFHLMKYYIRKWKQPRLRIFPLSEFKVNFWYIERNPNIAILQIYKNITRFLWLQKSMIGDIQFKRFRLSPEK